MRAWVWHDLLVVTRSTNDSTQWIVLQVFYSNTDSP